MESEQGKTVELKYNRRLFETSWKKISRVFVLEPPAYFPKYDFVPDAVAARDAVLYAIARVNAEDWRCFKIANTPASRGMLVCAQALMDEKYWIE